MAEQNVTDSDKKKNGDSLTQRELEGVAIGKLNIILGCKLIPMPVDINGGTIQFDGYDIDKNIVCEVYCGIDGVKPGQVKKVITDAFKMILYEKVSKKPCTKILLFVNEGVRDKFQSKSWYSMAFKEFGIETEVVEILKEEIIRLKATKELQGSNFR